MQLVSHQRFLTGRTFFVCGLLIDLLQSVALDMYTPALPVMQQAFGVSALHMNQTVFMFLLFSAVAMVLSGSVSDQKGRKPVLVFASVLFTASSVVCTVSQSMTVLVLGRCGQAIGYGISSTIAPALLKDSYQGRDLKTSLSLMQSLVIIGPVAAPFLGSLMLGLMDWRGIFVLLAVFGAITIVLTLLVTETLPPEARTHEGFARTMRLMGTDMKHLTKVKGFRSLTVFFALGGMPFFAFIACSSYILLDEFGLGYLEYSLVYAAACFVNMLAPYVYLVLSKKLDIRRIGIVCTALTCVSAVLLAAFAHLGAAFLLLAFVPYALAEGIIRPGAYIELLDQPPTLVGTASALSSFSYCIVTALITVVATMPWPTFLFGLVCITAFTAALLAVLAARDGRSWDACRYNEVERPSRKETA